MTRQRVDWQRLAARDLAEGRFDAAVAAFDRNGAVTWTADQDAARAALVARWTADTATEPKASRFVFAYTNADVSQLNVDLRQVRRDRGDLAGPDARFETKHGPADFAVGDRVQFTDTDKRLHIYNGNAGVITGIDVRSGTVTVRLDAAAGAPGREVTWSATEFPGFRHGYAGTIYKGQGKTLDHTYLLHSHHWRSSASYVAPDPPARECAGVRCHQHGAGRPPAGAADGAGRGAGRIIGRLEHGGRTGTRLAPVTDDGNGCSDSPEPAALGHPATRGQGRGGYAREGADRSGRGDWSAVDSFRLWSGRDRSAWSERMADPAAGFRGR